MRFGSADGSFETSFPLWEPTSVSGGNGHSAVKEGEAPLGSEEATRVAHPQVFLRSEGLGGDSCGAGPSRPRRADEVQTPTSSGNLSRVLRTNTRAQRGRRQRLAPLVQGLRLSYSDPDGKWLQPLANPFGALKV